VLTLNRDTIERGLFHRKPWVRALTLLALALALGAPVGAVIGAAGWLYGSAALIALALAYGVLRWPLVGVAALIGVICLLPFAALPVNIGFAPTFLDLILLGVFFVWINRLATHREPDFRADPPTLAVIVFLALSLISFVSGLAHARLTANVARHYAEIVLSVAILILIINTIRTREQLTWMVRALIVAGFIAALVGVVLYALPDRIAIRLLSMLRVVRYPSGSGVLRYVEDDPELPLRAISTSVDPNVLGGLLIFVTTLTTAQVFAQRPILPRWAVIIMAIVMALCLILTFSRGSFVGFVAAAGLLGVLRHRKLLWIGLLALGLLLLLPPAQAYVQHFIEGVQVQDQATQMRMGEYKDALKLIARYPWFGVGFAGTPEIDSYIGVSSVYLLIAEEMGLVGLAGFLAALGSFLAHWASALRPARGSEIEPLHLGLGLAVIGAMVGGVLDHYLFNLVFPHAAALLWLTVGLGVVATRLAKEGSS